MLTYDAGVGEVLIAKYRAVSLRMSLEILLGV